MDAHARPPQILRDIYKGVQKKGQETTLPPPEILDLSIDSLTEHPDLEEHVFAGDQEKAFRIFLESDIPARENSLPNHTAPPKVYESNQVPGKQSASHRLRSSLKKVGLFIYPDILPPKIQLLLLDKLLHRDLSNPTHQTNVHLHHNITYPSPSHTTFFNQRPTTTFPPKDPSIHKPLSLTQFLTKKLRWLTLGGQYDWTAKRYPSTPPPPFPSDTKQLLETLFPMLKAEAAIVNLYSPGDTLSLHRDVSEECDRPLVSLSLGCEGVFVVGLEDGGSVTVRLRSGDAVVMSGEARYAWHGVPKVVRGSCPEWMRDWPAGTEGGREFEDWRGWMEGKRVNLNVRQMFN
ncbi:hypothetical protein MBLNU230_g3686t1 [Neophaeotheca triangularis]